MYINIIIYIYIIILENDENIIYSSSHPRGDPQQIIHFRISHPDPFINVWPDLTVFLSRKNCPTNRLHYTPGTSPVPGMMKMKHYGWTVHPQIKNDLLWPIEPIAEDFCSFSAQGNRSLDLSSIVGPPPVISWFLNSIYYIGTNKNIS